MGTNISSTDFIGKFCEVANAYSRHEYDRAAGYLREAGIIPVGARGKSAPKLVPMTAAGLLLGMVAGNRPKNAVEAVKLCNGMKLEKKCPAFSSKKARLSLTEALAIVLGTASFAKLVAEVRILQYQGYPGSAKITFTDDASGLLVSDDKNEPITATFGGLDPFPKFYSEVVISGEVMAELAGLIG